MKWGQNVAFAACLALAASCATEPEAAPGHDWAIALHGGAGYFGEEDYSEVEQAAYRASLQRALDWGKAQIEGGAAALDVVEGVVALLEDDSLFNAGRGAVFTADGSHELDASLMDGRDRRCGAVTGLRGVANPIRVARMVMDSTEHVFLSGAGATAFARERGFPEVPDSYFDTEKARIRYEKARADDKRGTVGCVVRDLHGNVAAATSTGGMTMKRWGRIGDSPVVGAGTWADNRTCAVSATGWGEYFIRSSVAHDIHSRMAYANESVLDAAHRTIHEEMGNLGGDGGVIAVDCDGRIAFAFNSKGMFRAFAHSDGASGVYMFGEEGEATKRVTEPVGCWSLLPRRGCGAGRVPGERGRLQDRCAG